jgi:hypothetical protein
MVEKIDRKHAKLLFYLFNYIKHWPCDKIVFYLCNNQLKADLNILYIPYKLLAKLRNSGKNSWPACRFLVNASGRGPPPPRPVPGLEVSRPVHRHSRYLQYSTLPPLLANSGAPHICSSIVCDFFASPPHPPPHTRLYSKSDVGLHCKGKACENPK